eukprot:scaffold1130_cov195-Pinguiococcus_pyrenoidosus.AAC.108
MFVPPTTARASESPSACYNSRRACITRIRGGPYGGCEASRDALASVVEASRVSQEQGTRSQALREGRETARD